MEDIETIRSMAAEDAGLALVSVARENGSVHTSLVYAGLSRHPVTGAEVIGFVARGSAVKLHLLERNPQATVAWRVGRRWVAADGPVELCGPGRRLVGFDPDDLPQLLRQLFMDAGGTHDDWDEYDRAMVEDQRTAVFVSPDRIVGRG